jgi:hypothetical protein
MSILFRTFRWLATVALACAMGVLPSCASMGGGMKYSASNPFSLDEIVSM